MASEPLQILEGKLDQKNFLLGVIGLGYVGLPLSLTFLRKQIHVLGFDLDPEKVTKLHRNESYIKHIEADELTEFINEDMFEASTDFNRLNEPDCLLICVPTPLTKSREPDLKYVESTAKAIAKVMRPGQLVILESTTYPGTTEEVLKTILEENGLKVGKDFALAYSPEREDPGNPRYATADIPKVVGGLDPLSTQLGNKLYSAALDSVIPVSSSQIAELTKLLENIFRSVNIALVNELKMLCHRMDINVWEVIDAASTKPFGFMPFYPGPGLGGHCIPIDPFYLTSKAREYDFSTKFIELAGEVNTSMPYYVVQRVVEVLNQSGKSIKNAKILILGAAYKKDVDDPRESPTFKLLELLENQGAQVSYNDPHIPQLQPGRHHNYALHSIPLSESTLQDFDCVLVATDHSAYDYGFILENSKLIVDTRNVFTQENGNKEHLHMA